MTYHTIKFPAPDMRRFSELSTKLRGEANRASEISVDLDNLGLEDSARMVRIMVHERERAASAIDQILEELNSVPFVDRPSASEVAK